MTESDAAMAIKGLAYCAKVAARDMSTPAKSRAAMAIQLLLTEIQRCGGRFGGPRIIRTEISAELDAISEFVTRHPPLVPLRGTVAAKAPLKETSE